MPPFRGRPVDFTVPEYRHLIKFCDIGYIFFAKISVRLFVVKQIKLAQGKFTIVDDEDFERLNQYAWKILNGYVVRNPRNGFKTTGVSKYKYTTLRMHRDILNALPHEYVDHINRDTLDNRRCNLRICTSSQNSINRKKVKGQTSRYKGVSRVKNIKKRPWQARLNNTRLGCYASEDQAALAYNEAAIKLYGEFALLNDIIEVFL